jgi:uncharacterized protein
MIIKQGSKYILKSKDGSKNLGEFNTKEEAEKRERQILFFENRKDSISRIDRGALLKVEITKEGYLKAPATITRAGVFNYLMPDGTVRRELRPPEEVFNPASMATIEGIPITNDHPKIGLLTPETAKDKTVGFTGENAFKEGDDLRDHLTFIDKETIDDIKDGKVELSAGYDIQELEENPGVFNGEPYDAIQRGIVYNHVAVVDRGRAGNAKIHLDSEAAPNAGYQINIKKDKLMKIDINGKEFEVSDEAGAAFNKFKADQEAKMKEMKKDTVKKDEYDTIKKDNDELKEKVKDLSSDGIRAKYDSLENENKGLKDQISKYKEAEDAKKLDAVSSIAKKMLGDDLKLDGLNEIEIKKKVIESRVDGINLEGESENYINSFFDAERAKFDSSGEASNEVGKVIHSSRADASKTDAEEELEKSVAKASSEKQDAWQKPL